MTLARTTLALLAVPLLALTTACDADSSAESTFRTAGGSPPTLSITAGGDDPAVVLDAAVAADVLTEVGTFGAPCAALTALDAGDDRTLRARVPGVGLLPSLFDSGDITLHAAVSDSDDDAQTVSLTTDAPIASFDVSVGAQSGLTTSVALAGESASEGGGWAIEAHESAIVTSDLYLELGGSASESPAQVHVEAIDAAAGAPEGCGDDVESSTGVTVLAWARVDGETSLLEVAIPPACEAFIHRQLDEDGLGSFAVEVGDDASAIRLAFHHANDVTFKRGVLRATAQLEALTEA